MKKLITLILLISAFSIAKTINILELEVEYKYTSNKSYHCEFAHSYCKDKEGCVTKRNAKDGLCTINKNPKNCPELKTGNMDEYIAKPSDMIRFVRNCFSSKVRYEGDVVSFVHKKREYYYYHTHDYDNHYGKIYKIKKKNGDLIEFKEN